MSVVKYIKPPIVSWFSMYMYSFSLVDSGEREENIYLEKNGLPFVHSFPNCLFRKDVWHLITPNFWCSSRQLCHLTAKQKCWYSLMLMGYFGLECIQLFPYV